MNINVFIFSRTQPQKKLEVIEALSNDELLAVSESTVKKIIKEVGQKRYKAGTRNSVLTMIDDAEIIGTRQ